MRLEERMNRLGFTSKMRKSVNEIREMPGVDGVMMGNYKGGTCYPDGHCLIKNNGSLVAYLSNGKGGTVPVTVHTKTPDKVYGMLSAKYSPIRQKEAKDSGFLAVHLRNIEQMLSPYAKIVDKKVFQLNGIPSEARIMYHGSDGDTHCLSIIEPPGKNRQAMRVKVSGSKPQHDGLKRAIMDYSANSGLGARTYP